MTLHIPSSYRLTCSVQTEWTWADTDDRCYVCRLIICNSWRKIPAYKIQMRILGGLQFIRNIRHNICKEYFDVVTVLRVRHVACANLRSAEDRFIVFDTTLVPGYAVFFCSGGSLRSSPTLVFIGTCSRFSVFWGQSSGKFLYDLCIAITCMYQLPCRVISITYPRWFWTGFTSHCSKHPFRLSQVLPLCSHSWRIHRVSMLWGWKCVTSACKNLWLCLHSGFVW